jgi:acyl-CoA synthetase (AMP-forming)/AMP-acid ligase II
MGSFRGPRNRASLTMDLHLVLTMAVSMDGDRSCVTGPEGRTLTTRQLDAYAAGAASILRGTGVGRVAFCDTNGLAFPVTLFGAVKAGLPLVPLNYRLSDDQLGEIVRAHELVAVASSEQAERLRKLGVGQVFESSEFLDEADVAAPSEVAPTLELDDVALFLFTSGTTAAPKAAILRHRHLAAYVIGTVEFGSAGAHESSLISVPPYHIAGVMNLLSNLYMGRRVVYLDTFTPERWLATIVAEGITHAMVVPTMLARIVSALGREPANLPTLRTISYGGAKVPTTVIEEALRLFPEVAFTNAYGLTETSSTIAVLGPDTHRQALSSSDPEVRARLGSVGLPLPGVEIEVRDDLGLRTPLGDPGDIFVRGEQVAGEYEGIGGSGEGWFATRDRGHLDAAGYLYIEGRADDTIIRGGENIAPAEIEAALLAHDDVQDCAVVGIADDEWGQRIVAAVVVAPDKSVDVDLLRDFVRERLRSAKTPEYVVVVRELPYTDTGKLLRRVVRSQLADMVFCHDSAHANVTEPSAGKGTL